MQWRVTATIAAAMLNEDAFAPPVVPIVVGDRACDHLGNTARQLGLADGSASSHRFRKSHHAAVMHQGLYDGS